MFTDNHKKQVFVIGHKNPDSDSICSAIGYAYLKNILEKKYIFVPARVGDLNRETEFVLEKFKFNLPMEIKSLAITVSDMNLKYPDVKSLNDSIKDAFSLMKNKNIRTLPIIDHDKKPLGIVGPKEIEEYHLKIGSHDLSTTPIDLEILISTLNGKVITNPKKIERLCGRVFIATMQKATVLNEIQTCDVSILGDRADIQKELINSGCSALIITDNSPISQEVFRSATKNGTLIISSPHDTFYTARSIDLSKPLYSIMSKDVPIVGLYTQISELKQKVLESNYRCALIVDADNRLCEIATWEDLSGLHQIKKKVILVDHNETSQAVDNVQEGEILEIIDHHRGGDILRLMPPHVRFEPYGSTCTIVAELMFHYPIGIPQNIAGLLLSGILSNTKLLTLSSTTERDKQVACQLARIADIEIEGYGKELSKAINLKEKSTKEIKSHQKFKKFFDGIINTISEYPVSCTLLVITLAVFIGVHWFKIPLIQETSVSAI